MRARLLGLAITVVLVATACGGSGNGGAPGAESASPLDELAPQEGVVSRVLAGEMELEVSGGVDARFSGPTPINVLTSVGGQAPPEFWQLTVGVLPQHILEVGDGIKVRPAFDLIGYDGDGSYTIRPADEGGLSEEELAEVRDNPELLQERQGGFLPSGVVFVVSEDDDAEVTNYNALEEPCTVEVSNQGNRGSIECPSVTNGEDAVAFSWSWNANPDQVLENLTEGGSPVAAPDSGNDGAAATNDGDPTTDTSVVDEGDDSNDPDSGNGQDDDHYRLRKPYKLEIDITPNDCATRGTAAAVQVETIPDANITMVVVYSDAQPHGNTILGTTGPTGDFNWAFNVAATAPEGQADLIINVSPREESDETESGGGIVPAFEVKSLC